MKHIARHTSRESLDDYPTPPWAVRAFFEYVEPKLRNRKLVFREPACGRGHMVRTLLENRKFAVDASDIKDYGSGYREQDFLNDFVGGDKYDVLFTNPPYKAANDFVVRGLSEARVGIAVLVKTLWLEGGKNVPTSRWCRVLRDTPPTRIAIVSARMPARKGAVIQRQASFISHSWVWWNKEQRRRRPTEFIWIPPDAQKDLEKPEDYA